jgi:hypothetical protein
LKPKSYLAILSHQEIKAKGWQRSELWKPSSKTSNVAMMSVTNAGRASNTLTCLRGMASCTPRGVSQRQATKVLAVPRTTRQAWRAWQDRLDACPQVVAFFESVPGLAFLHRLVLALPVVFVAVGACGIRLVCLLLQITGLNRCVGASCGAQQQVNRHVEEAIVAYRREETVRLAQEMPPKDRTVTQEETFTGGLCLVAIEPVSNSILLEQPAEARDHRPWSEWMEGALAPLKC